MILPEHFSIFGFRFSIFTPVLALMLFCVTVPAGAQDADTEDDDKSKERLIRKTQGLDEEDIMASIIRQMHEVHERLDEFFDVSLKTQETQQQILKDLDDAIEQAKQNLRTQRSSPQGEGDKREQGETSDQDQSSSSASGEEGSAGTSAGQGGDDESEAGSPGPLHERQRQWGNLPQRDRDEIMQSFNEDVLEKYRELINRYYEALSRPAEEE